MQRAALRSNAPAGTQIGLVPMQSLALMQASVAQTFVGTTTTPPQLGSIGPKMHFAVPGPCVQSADLQH